MGGQASGALEVRPSSNPETGQPAGRQPDRPTAQPRDLPVHQRIVASLAQPFAAGVRSAPTTA
jgi:hypothetical protein